MIEKHQCGDCKLYLPRKNFAVYRQKRHPLCRTCMAVDVAEFKAWVLPYVEVRKAQIEFPYHYQDWEIIVAHRMELDNHKKLAMIRRGPNAVAHMRAKRVSNPQKEFFADPMAFRPWKFEQEERAA